MVTQKPDGSVEFRFFRPEASHVTVAGDFNGWHQGSFPMIRGEDGWWRYRISLSAGVYQFRYVADGVWYTDYAAFGLERTGLGWNSVLKVDPILPEQMPISKPPERLRSLTAELAELLAGARPENRPQELVLEKLSTPQRIAPERRQHVSEEAVLAGT